MLGEGGLANIMRLMSPRIKKQPPQWSAATTPTRKQWERTAPHLQDWARDASQPEVEGTGLAE